LAANVSRPTCSFGQPTKGESGNFYFAQIRNFLLCLDNRKWRVGPLVAQLPLLKLRLVGPSTNPQDLKKGILRYMLRPESLCRIRLIRWVSIQCFDRRVRLT